MKSFGLALAALLGVVGLSFALLAADGDKIDIKAVMKEAMKGGLQKKVASGQATAEEKERLIVLFAAMCENKPPKGEEASWKSKTDALLAAAKAAKEGGPGAAENLAKAANCAACHKAHKGD